MGSHGRINGSDPGFAIDDIPDTPTVGTVTLNSATATVPVTAPVTGGKITYYKATSNPGSITATSTTSTVTVSNLSPSTSYTFTVQTGNPYWISNASSSSNSVTVGTDTAYIWTFSGLSGYGTFALDSSSNIHFCGYKNLSGYRGYAVKFNSTGTRQWETQLTPSSGNFYPAYTAVDSSGNVYMAGDWDANANDFYLVKFNSSGVLQWQRYLGDQYNQGCYGMTIDSSANVYLIGYHNQINAQYRAYVAKYNTSGTLQWDYVLRYSTNTNSFFYNVYTDNSYVYLTGYCPDSSGYSGAVMLRIDTGGGFNLMRFSRDQANNASGYGYAITADSSSNIYIGGVSNSQYYIIKYNSGGTVQWWKVWTTGFSDLTNLVTDSSGNVYVTLRRALSGYGDAIYVAKFDSSGTLQWERLLTKNNRVDSIAPRSNFIKISGNYLIFCSSNGELFKLPTDGSLTGTYTIGSNTYTWASTSATIGTTGLYSYTASGTTWESSGRASNTATFASSSTTYSSASGTRF